MDVKTEPSAKECVTHSAGILSRLGDLKCNGAFCDVTILTDDATLGAHKVVLVAASHYFEAMFRHNLTEKESGIIKFPETRSDIVKLCIEFIYSGKVEISNENVQDLMDAAEMMQLPELSRLCVEFLAENVTLETCARLITLSYLFEKKDLDLPLKNFLFEHFDEFMQTKDFMELGVEPVAYCLKLLQGGGRDFEQQKWNVILSWVRHDPNIRGKEFGKLFEILDLSLLPNRFLKEVILKEPLVQKSASCLLPIAKFYADDDIDSSPPAKQPRKMSHIVVCKKESQIIVKYDLAIREWSSLARFPGELQNQAEILSHNDRLYVGTGYKLYEYANNVWKSGCPGRVLKLSKSCRGVCVCNSSCPCHTGLYCFNRCIAVGDSVFMLTKESVHELNIVTSKLTCHSVGVDLGDDFFVTASDEKMYAFGGAETEHRAIEIDVITKFRSRLCNMQYPKNTGHAFWFEGKAYTFGGQNYPAKVECYEPERDVWFTVRNFLVSHPPAKVYISTRLYLVGGTARIDNITSFSLQKLRRYVTEDDALSNTSFCCPGTS